MAKTKAKKRKTVKKARPARRATRHRAAPTAREERMLLAVDRLDGELAAAAYFDPASILEPETGATLPLHQWPENARRALASYEEEALFETVDTGEVGPRGGAVKARVQVGVIRKVKWLDKTAAQRLAYQRLGALVEKHQHQVVAAATDSITDEEWEELAQLRHRVRARAGGNG